MKLIMYIKSSYLLMTNKASVFLYKVCVTQKVNIMSLEQKQMCPIQLQALLVGVGFPNGMFKSRVKKLWS